MIGKYLPQTNENATVAKSKKIRILGQVYTARTYSYADMSFFLFLFYFVQFF